MPNYTYKARAETGKSITGILEGASQDEVAHKLRKMGYIPVRIEESSSSPAFFKISYPLQRISVQDIIVFNFQLANMLSAGLTLLTSLYTTAKQTQNKRLRAAIEEISRSVEAGSSFSESLLKHPKIFSRLFISMVKAGEMTGYLTNVLQRLGTYLEAQEDLRQRIRGALFYPAILLCAGVAVIILIVSFVMPQFVDIFHKAQIPLPWPTRVLYTLGVVLKQFWYVILAVTGLIYFAMKGYISQPAGRLKYDQFMLSLPVVGLLIRQAVISRFSRTLATLIESGVPLLQALDVLSDVVGNEVIAGVVRNIRKSVEQGEGIAAPVRVSEEFPPDCVQMISAGEEAGKLDEMLNKTADFYDSTLTYSIKKLTTLIEPVFLLIMGGMVGFIMISMLLPIFDMVKTLRH